MIIGEDELKWAKRFARKGPFYLISATENPKSKASQRMMYHVIWKDNDAVKIGYFKDGMSARYGIQTEATLRGVRPHDLWNGSSVTDEEFELMRQLYLGQDTGLEEFDFVSVLNNVTW